MMRLVVKRKRRNQQTQPTNRSSNSHAQGSQLLTFQDHLQELRNRLFWVAMVFLLASAAVYPFFDKILAVLVQPIGDQPLHYLTPAGGFGFIIKVCMYAGFVAAIPMVVYQIFRYIQPVMGAVRGRVVVAYILASVSLAATGIVLAYLFSLPAALNFLTGFELPQISAMLTADSYFSFVMTYLLAAAILFQLPLILLIINNVTPLDPGTMMKQQRYVILVAFILGAIISPTPDALNQLLMSGPIIVMYQVGVFLVIAQNYLRKRARTPRQSQPSYKPQLQPIRKPTLAPQQAARPSVLPPVQPIQQRPTASFDMVAAPRQAPHHVVPASHSAPALKPAPRAPIPQRGGYRRSIDGFAMDG